MSKRLLSKLCSPADENDVKQYISRDLTEAAVCKYGTQSGDIVFYPPPILKQRINELAELCDGDGTFFVRWSNLSSMLPLDFIMTNSFPWDLVEVGRRHDHTPLTIRNYMSFASPMDYLGGTSFTFEWFKQLGVFSLFPGYPLGPGHEARVLRGVWRLVPYLHFRNFASSHFAWHSAAGVVQRCWRRHRERLRRRTYACLLAHCSGTILMLLPRDLLWMLYRYVRVAPPGALLGLPPKLR
jgi:hypothetical protein